MHRSLTEISPLFDDPPYRQHVLIGGDSKTWSGWPASEATTLARDLTEVWRRS